jgi:Tfp pilus assembly PilM family ATPase
MANRVIGIEFAPDSLKLIEVTYGRRLKVHNFAIVDNRAIDPARRVEQLNHTLQVRGFEAKDAMVAVNGIQVEHRLLTLPPLSGRELKFVMQREAKKSAPAGVTDTNWDFDILQSKEELGIKKRQILLVTSSTELVAEAQEFFANTRLKVQRVTSIGESLLNLTHNVGFWKKEVVKNIVHFGPASVHVLFVQQGTLLLCRDIPLRYGDVDQDQLYERLITEIKRSTLFFRQNFPQGEINEVLLSGESDMIGNLVSRAGDDLGIETNALRFDDNLDRSAFRGDWDEFRFHIPTLSAAFGAAWHKTPDAGLNLIPGKASSKEGPPVYKKLVKAAAILALAVSLFSGGRYVLGTRTISAAQLQIETDSANLDPILQEGADGDATRSQALRQSQLMGRMASGVDLEDAFRSLSLIIPETAVFDSIRVEPADDSNGTFALILRGNLSGTSPRPTNDFADFFEQLQGLEQFASVEMSQPTTKTVFSADEISAEDQTSPELISRLNFEVRCLLNSNS